MKRNILTIITAVTLISILIPVLTAQTEQATEAKGYYFVNGDNIAINGYDTVAYFTDGKAKKGDSKYTLTHDKVEWRFSSRKNMELFKKNPSEYIPQYGGWCAYGVGMDSKVTGYPQDKYAVNPESFEIKDGKLYLFFHGDYSGQFFDAKKQWSKDKNSHLKRGDAWWKKADKK